MASPVLLGVVSYRPGRVGRLTTAQGVTGFDFVSSCRGKRAEDGGHNLVNPVTAKKISANSKATVGSQRELALAA